MWIHWNFHCFWWLIYSQFCRYFSVNICSPILVIFFWNFFVNQLKYHWNWWSSFLKFLCLFFISKFSPIVVIFLLNFFVNHRWFHQNWWIIHHFQCHLSARLNYCLSLWKFYRKYLQFIQIFTNFGEPSSTSIFTCTKKIGQHRYCHQIWWFLFLLEIHGKCPPSPFINLILQMQKSGNFSDGMVQWWRSGGSHQWTQIMNCVKIIVWFMSQITL